ncbi:hypothetical protein ANRL1_01094 [Anaerolineae bacterium]|nr:hypothetical protein ANRL1_01094 [Anaerolineae bacterium]
MKRRAAATLGLACSLAALCLGQGTESTGGGPARVTLPSPVRWDVAFRSVQCDGASLIFSNAVSGSLDLDVLNLTRTASGKVGLRLGMEWQGIAGVGGDRNYYHDLNILLRVTAAGESGRFDLLFGTCSRGRETWGFGSESAFAGKLGAEGRLNVISNIVWLLGKLSISERLNFVGIGLSIGYDSWQVQRAP